MDKKKVLIVGGYGNVGSAVAKILAKDERISLVISGRNEAKARESAHKLQAEWRTIDISNEKSISPSLTNIDIVINCFSGPFTHFPLYLPEISAIQGIHYLDVSGSYENAERFIKLNEIASKNDATLITALGANPGIPGIALMSTKGDFDVLETGRIVFVMGARIEEVSVPALKELKYMFDVKPMVWKKPHWAIPKEQGSKEYIGKPFEKDVYLGTSLTRDLLVIPELTDIEELSFWAGSQSTIQGLVMILGMKLGFTSSDIGAHLLMNIIQKIGSSKESKSDIHLKVVVTGKKEGIKQKRTIEMYCDENYATALAPAIVCQQIIEKKIMRYGSFLPPEIVPAVDFMEKLRNFAVHYSARTEKI